MSVFKKTAMAAGVLAAMASGIGIAEASHFRGAAMIPSVDANGLLTVTTTSFWRPTGLDNVTTSVTGVNRLSHTTTATDTSDVRFTKVTDVDTFRLNGAGTYDISGSSCCRVGGIHNINGGNSSISWTMNSTIAWDGKTANTPILFNFSSIQPEVVRNSDYNGTLGAVAGHPGLTLTYDQALNSGITTQPQGFTVDPTTGALHIAAADTNTYLDNPSGNIGADYAFSGNITASDGSKVEFDWLFDAVNTGSGNLAPVVQDDVINALVGDTINYTVLATDDGKPLPANLTFSFIGVLGGPANAPTFDATTHQFNWSTVGSNVGTYIAQFLVSDGSMTDIGNLRINLTNGNGNPTPEPAVLSLLGVGLLGFGLARRRNKQA